jgi:hypothetical protein
MDLYSAALHINMRSAQTQAANILFAEAGIIFGAVKGAQLIGNGMLAWSALSASEKIAYYGLLGETFSVVNGTVPSSLGASFSLAGASGFIVPVSRYILPRMRIRAVGRDRVKIRDGKRVIEKANKIE